MIKSENILDKLKNPVLYLILTNLLVLVLALIYDWNIGEIIWTFLIQNIIIGFFNFLRIIKSKSITPAKGRTSIQTPATAQAMIIFLKLFLGFFFLGHYGAFNIGYAVFLLVFFKNVNFVNVLITGAIFLIPHFISYRQKLKQDEEEQGISIFKLMFIPYLRIIPMHIIIFVAVFIGSETKLTLIIFIILKTIADVAMHLVERKLNEASGNSIVKSIKNEAIKNGTRKS